MTSDTAKKRILFTGYASIHFVCFLPVYKLLADNPQVEIFLSGGFKRTGDDGEDHYSLEGFYDEFPVDPAHVIPIERVREEHYDILVSASLTDALFPKSVDKKVQIFHGVSFKNLAVREKALNYDLLCLPGHYHAELYEKNGLIRPEGTDYLVTGFPKMDPLRAGELDREALLRDIGVDPALPTVLFAPTGEKHNALDTVGLEVIRSIRNKGSWNLLIKPHDHPKKDIDWFQELGPLENERLKLVRDKDIIPYLHAADLLLTDASSVAVEYTLMDRPIVFIDVPKLFKRLLKRAPSLDLETYGRKIGSIALKPSKVVEVIEDALANPEREGELRRKMSEHVFFDTGNAAGNVAEVILFAAGIVNALPGSVEVVGAGSVKANQ